MFVYLLTHEKELLRKSGTGVLVKTVLTDLCQIIPWKRVEPSPVLKEILDIDNTVLVYPGEDSTLCNELVLESIENFILLDGTWQESQKMFNRSPYLKRFKKVMFSENLKSKYILRRNQKSFGLCTIESVIELSKIKCETELTEKLCNKFKTFNIM